MIKEYLILLLIAVLYIFVCVGFSLIMMKITQTLIDKQYKKRLIIKEEETPLADLKFILFHRPTKTQIEMPVLLICEEYSTLSFRTSENAYDGKYNGIGCLPSYIGDDTADDYDVYVNINGVKHLYNGIFLSKYKEIRRN